ncbi:MAG TPA: iron-containing alcohol dehydrogenase [Bryobacteraceae bacterium]|nr:iron-containing alcohol dehydrogenase [Bryobacteraceae bacterium]
MPVSTFSFPTTILFGAGAIERLPEELHKRGISHPLLVTDAGLARTPVFARVRSLAPAAAVFSGVEPNPTEGNVAEGVACYHENRCNGVVGLGGGSPLDAAKAIRLKVTHELPLAEYDDLLDGSNRISAHVAPYIAIATTAGTGSEVSRSTVITITATNRKTVVFSPHLIPTVAIADPELTLDLPGRLTAGTGMDAFTHNVEAYIAKGYHPICDAIAISGARMAWDNLPRAMAEPRDLEARANMMMASMMGAIAFQKGLGAVHSLAHPLSSDCGMHHGTANAVLLPVVLEFNRPAVAGRLADLEAQFGGGDIAAQVRDLNRRVGIAPRLRDYGVAEAVLSSLADKAIQDGCHQLNPRPCTREDLLALYRAAY